MRIDVLYQGNKPVNSCFQKKKKEQSEHVQCANQMVIKPNPDHQLKHNGVGGLDRA